MKKTRKPIITVIAAVLTLLSASLPAVARQINVRGVVTDEKGEPLNATCIFDAETNVLLGQCDDEGKFLIVTEDDGILLFDLMGCEELQVPVNGQLTIDVTLVRDMHVMQEVLVTGKSMLKTVKLEDSEMEVRGNYILFKNRIRVPRKLFNTSTRLIIQPELWNLTRNRKQYMKPLVFDGKRYNMTQDRMHDFNATETDPLWRYVKVASKEYASGSGDLLIPYNDSVYVERPNEDYRCDFMESIEDYNKILWTDTTVAVRGVKNPLRFFQYTTLGREISDKAYFPTPEMALRPTEGGVNLTFDLNKTTLDMSRPQNRQALDSLIADLHAVEEDPNSAIKSFYILCTASPDGNYDKNLQLSRMRMESALDIIFSSLSDATRKYTERTADSKVESWYTLVDMLNADGKEDLAARVKAIVDKYGDRSSATSVNVRRLPEYQSVIAAEYLPRMRSVSYKIVTSRYRFLTDDEIRDLYAQKPDGLSQYEYFRMYRDENITEAEKEKILRDALKAHPRFAVAANDLAAMMINRGTPDPTILEPFVTKKQRRRLPDEISYNQVAADLALYNYSRADSLAQTLSDDKALFRDIKIYSALFNGRFDVDTSKLSERSPLNDVILLLCMKMDKQAWRACAGLGNTAEDYYVMAICANRVDGLDGVDTYQQANDYLTKAIKLKPELREIARIDGDLNEVLERLEEEERQEQGQTADKAN